MTNGLFGSGGGMISVPLFEKSGMETKKSHASSIAVTAVLSAVSLVFYLTGGKTDFHNVVKYIVPGLLGAYVGAKFLKNIKNELLARIFGAVMIFAGIVMIFRNGE